MLRRQFLCVSACAGGVSLLLRTMARGESLPLADPKSAIAHQLQLLHAGDTDQLRACFTPRQQPKITPALVASAQQTARHMPLDELVHTIQMEEFEGKQTARITMQNGRTLTTLILTDGRWLSDTIWFK